MAERKDKVWRLVINYKGKKYTFLTGGNIFDRLRKFCYDVGGWKHKKEIPIYDEKTGKLVEVIEVATCEIPLSKGFKFSEDESFKVWSKKKRAYISESGDLLVIKREPFGEDEVLDLSDIDEVKADIGDLSKVLLHLEKAGHVDDISLEVTPEVSVLRIAVGKKTIAGAGRPWNFAIVYIPKEALGEVEEL